jgi:hypothetical protein
MELVKVKSSPNLARAKSGAIININTSEIRAAKEAKVRRKKKFEEDRNLKDKVENLSKDMVEIKSLLLKIVENNNGKS